MSIPLFISKVEKRTHPLLLRHLHEPTVTLVRPLWMLIHPSLITHSTPLPLRGTLEPRPSQSSQVVSDVIATPTEPSFSHVPSFDHHSVRTRTDESETSELDRSDEDEISELDLNSCEQVVYEVRDVPGVSYVNDGDLGWTPVKKKCPRKKAEAAGVSVSSESDSSDLCFPGCNISYKSRSGIPGLLVQGKSKIWTPIAARTRKKK